MSEDRTHTLPTPNLMMTHIILFHLNTGKYKKTHNQTSKPQPMIFKFAEEKENLIKDTTLRDIKLVTGYKFLRKYSTAYSYAERIKILSDEFHLSAQGVKNIIQKYIHK